MTIHISFRGTNSSSVEVFQADAGRQDSLDSVTCRPEQMEQLMTFVKDIREMPEEQWQQVLKAISSKL